MHNSKPYTIVWDADDARYLVCQVFQLPRLDEYRAMLAEVVDWAKRGNIERVLFDARAVPARFSILDGLAYGESIVEIIPPRFRLATLVNQEAPNRRFVETFALNRGIYLNYFTDRDQALAWLLSPFPQLSQRYGA
jgi:hypothetical protein